MERLKLATVWLGGCSGCLMSFLDLDEWLLELTRFADLVYSPFLDQKEYPADVDAVLVEGAVANDDHITMLRRVRASTRWLVSFGDCAVTGNVTAMRNPLGSAQPVLHRSYVELAESAGQIPRDPGVLPTLIDIVLPLHHVVPVDYYVPGCPPPADRIRTVLESLCAGCSPQLSGRDLQFG